MIAPRGAGLAALGAFLSCIMALALLQLWGWGGSLNADGVSYLDLAAQYARGDLTAVANGYWSPLYPMLLGAALALARVSATNLGDAALTPELCVVFAVNLGLLIATTCCFVRLQMVLDARDSAEVPGHVRVGRIGAGVALWIWCAIRLVGTATITPDLLLAGWLFLASAELVEASCASPSRRRAAVLATCLALGYCTKAVIFPVLLGGIAAYLLSIPGQVRRAHLPWLIAPVLALAAPLVIVQSIAQGRPSFGETGRLNYGWYVDDVPRAPARVESVEASRERGMAAPAIVQLTSVPRTVLFTGDVGGSFPYWYDPSRYEPTSGGGHSVRASTRTLGRNVHWYRVVAGAFALLCAIAAAAASVTQRIRLNRVMAMIPALMLIGIYGLTHPEGRLAGSPIVAALLMMLYASGPRRRAAVASDVVWHGVEGVAIACLVILALGRTSNRVPLSARELQAGPARELARLGVQGGAGVGLIGSPYGHYWAHQSGVHIAAVREDGADPAPPGEPELLAMATESCARGVPLAAILWPGAPVEGDMASVPVSGGWSVWRVTALQSSPESCEAPVLSGLTLPPR